MTSARARIPGYRALGVYLGGAFAGGSLLAPWLYSAGHALAARVPAMGALAAYSFHRYMDRSALLVAFVGLWPFLRALGVRSWKELGLFGGEGRLRRLLGGLALSAGTLALAAALALVGGARILSATAPAGVVLHRLGVALVSAVAVAVLEETLFRGVLFGGLRRALPWQTALLLTSMVYAGVHFLQPPSDPASVIWSSGLTQLPAAFAALGDLQRLLPGFLNLTLAGGLLALAYQRSGDLWCSFGLHAGWIFWIRCYDLFTTATAPSVGYWGSDALMDGWLAMLVLAVTLPGLVWALPRPLPEPGGGE